MDGTIPTALGQWAVDTAQLLLAYPGTYGWGVITGIFGPTALRWIGRKLPAARKR